MIEHQEEKSQFYHFKKIEIILFSLLSLFFIFLGFATNFSVKEQVLTKLKTTLAKNRSCPVNFEKSTLSYLLPTLTLNKVSVNRRCFKSASNLELDSIKTSLALPSLKPLGPTLTTIIKDQYSKVNIDIIPGISDHYIKASSKKN